MKQLAEDTGDTCESSAFAQVSDAETRGTAPVPNHRLRKGWRGPGRRREPQPGMTPDLPGARSGQGRQGGVSTATREQKTDRSSLGEVAAQRRVSRPWAHVDAISGHVRGLSESGRAGQWGCTRAQLQGDRGLLRLTAAPQVQMLKFRF